jgi:DNA replication ATP-dependent helicase Dna2
MWDNQQSELGYTAALSPMMPRRGRKRARSSSPTSSPAHDKPNTPLVNIRKLSQALRSPHADPTLELWDRFTLSGSAITPVTNPTLAQLMAASSPRPSKSSMGNMRPGGLRKALSSGLTRPKRRRLESSDIPMDFMGRVDVDESKTSLVTALLDTVTSSMQDASPDGSHSMTAETPSMRKRRNPMLGQQSSSPIRRHLNLKGSTSTAAATGDGPSRDNTSVLPHATEVQRNILEYEDGHFDGDTLIELETSISKPKMTGKDKVLQLGPGTSNVKQSTLKDNALLIDEFDDGLDDEMFAEAEDLMAKFDSQPIPESRPMKQEPQETLISLNKLQDTLVGTDDIFGDDFGDDFDFEAAELAATQSVKPAKAPIPAVCQNV